MSQAIGTNNNWGSYSPATQGSYTGPQPYYDSNRGMSLDLMNIGSSYNYDNDPPMFGPMQGGGGNSFGSGSASQDRLNSLLNIDPIKDQVTQLGGKSTDHSSPSNYCSSVLDPIMKGASQAAAPKPKNKKDAEAPKKQT